MSRGGRGGGRGGRSRMPWGDDPTMKPDSKPTELFPAFSVPHAAPLLPQERRVVDYLLLVHEHIHHGPLYTQTRTKTESSDKGSGPNSHGGGGGGGGGGGATGRAYGQDQINQQYGVRNKATVDPFVSVPLYAHRFQRQDRALPDLAARPFSRELFPPELWPTLEGNDGAAAGVGSTAMGNRRRRPGKRLALSEVTTLRTAEDIFKKNAPKDKDTDMAGDEDAHKALAQLEKLTTMGLDNEDNVEFDLVEDEGDYDEVEDEEYDDDEEGDYNAEMAFDNGDDDDYGDDFGDDGGGDEGVY